MRNNMTDAHTLFLDQYQEKVSGVSGLGSGLTVEDVAYIRKHVLPHSSSSSSSTGTGLSSNNTHTPIYSTINPNPNINSDNINSNTNSIVTYDNDIITIVLPEQLNLTIVSIVIHAILYSVGIGFIIFNCKKML